jgi:two-component system sensor histidine kinase DesK
VEAALAWTVREGATNVIRHSRARRCTITLRAGLADAEVDVVDDGVGAAALASASAHGDGAPPVASASAEGGHGIEGLRERVTRLGGTLDAAARPGGGFRLAAWVPLIAPVVSGDR